MKDVESREVFGWFVFEMGKITAYLCAEKNESAEGEIDDVGQGTPAVGMWRGHEKGGL